MMFFPEPGPPMPETAAGGAQGPAPGGRMDCDECGGWVRARNGVDDPVGGGDVFRGRGVDGPGGVRALKETAG